MIYLWKIKELKQDIKENKLTTKDYLIYRVFFISLYLFLFFSAISQIYNSWNSAMILIQVCVSGGGIYYAYSLNGGASGVNFYNKFFSLGWVFLLRSVFFMSIGMLNLYTMSYMFSIETLFSIKNSIIIGLLFEILLYWRIAKHMETLKSS